MESNIERFIDFSAIATKENRKSLTESIQHNLIKGTSSISLSSHDTGQFKDAITNFLSSEKIQSFCKENNATTAIITDEMIDFINQTKKQICLTKNPFQNERYHLSLVNAIEDNKTFYHLKKIKQFLNENYNKLDIDAKFYENELKPCLYGNQKNRSNKLEVIKNLLQEKWSALLLKKEIEWELEVIDKKRILFLNSLLSKIEEFLKLQNLLEPLSDEIGLFWDVSKGNWNKNGFENIRKYAKLMENDPSLAQLVDMLGKMSKAETEYEEELFANIEIKNEWVVNHSGKSELIGIKESNELSNVISSELVWLADSDLETVFYKKYAEKKLLTFDYNSKYEVFSEETIDATRIIELNNKKGPFIVCVDTSGSMHGTPETVAKTICFALLKMALKENRKCYLISFSTEIEILNLTDIKNSLPKLMDFLSMSFNGGTDASPAINESLRMLTTEDYKKADVLMISDFIMPSFNTQVKNEVKKAKENGTKFHNLVIGNFTNTTLTNEFDNNWVYNPNSTSVLSLVKNISNLNS